MTNEQELIALSKRVAEKLGIDAQYNLTIGDAVDGTGIWLYEDSKRCFELMCEYYLDVEVTTGGTEVRRDSLEVIEYHKNYNTHAATTRAAILKALEAL